MRIEWIRKGAYYLESDSGVFRIAKIYSQGFPRYSLFRCPPLGWEKEQGVHIGTYHTAKEAKGTAERIINTLGQLRAELEGGA